MSIEWNVAFVLLIAGGCSLVAGVLLAIKNGLNLRNWLLIACGLWYAFLGIVFEGDKTPVIWSLAIFAVAPFVGHLLARPDVIEKGHRDNDRANLKVVATSALLTLAVLGGVLLVPAS